MIHDSNKEAGLGAIRRKKATNRNTEKKMVNLGKAFIDVA